MNTTSFLVIVLAYFLGSFSFAVVVSRLMGMADPRTYGSKNPGATNVLRSGRKGAALLTLFLDGFKGWLPTWWAVQWGSAYGLGDMTVALVALAAFLGHLFPIFFRFQGGKGVATFLGVTLGLHPILGLGVAGSWLLIALFFRYSSLASLVAAVFAPFFYAVTSGFLWKASTPVLTILGGIAVLLFWRHRENITRLWMGAEGKIGLKS